MWTIPDESKNSWSIALLLTCHVLVSSFLSMMAISSGRLSLQLWIVQKTPCSIFCYDAAEKSSIVSALSIRSQQMLMRSPVWSWVRTRGTLYWVTRDMFRLSDGILWQVPWLPAAVGAISSTVWERFVLTSFATSWTLGSVMTVLGRLVCSSSSKLFVLLKHSTEAQGFFSVRLLDYLKHFASGIASNVGRTWRYSVAQTATFSISAACRQLTFTIMTFLLNTRTQVLHAGKREEWTPPSRGFMYSL
jgi:hypothetical protein